MLVFDVGGTFIKYAIIEDDNIIYKSKIPTPNGSDITTKLINVYEKLKKDYSLEKIGVSTAGQVDKSKGMIRFAGPTIPNYTGTKLKKELEKATGCLVYVANDVEACIYNYPNQSGLLYISLGTGIGGAFKYENTILYGENGGALEIGHMYHPSGDSFENICSTRSLLNKYAEISGEQITGEQFDALIQSSDKLSLELEDQYFTDLVTGLVNLKLLLDFNLVIIGGGITEATFFTSSKIMSRLPYEKYPGILEKLEIEVSDLGNDSPLIGMYNYIKCL